MRDERRRVRYTRILIFVIDELSRIRHLIGFKTKNNLTTNQISFSSFNRTNLVLANGRQQQEKHFLKTEDDNAFERLKVGFKVGLKGKKEVQLNYSSLAGVYRSKSRQKTDILIMIFYDFYREDDRPCFA